MFQTAEFKDNRALFARCLRVARSRPEIDVRGTLGKYEFTVHPRSLVNTKGNLPPILDVSKFMATLESLTWNDIQQNTNAQDKVENRPQPSHHH